MDQTTARPAYTDCDGAVWYETGDGTLSAIYQNGVWTLVDWSLADVEKWHGPLTPVGNTITA